MTESCIYSDVIPYEFVPSLSSLIAIAQVQVHITHLHHVTAY